MQHFEWVLTTPQVKEFKLLVPKTVTREVPKVAKAGGLPVLTPEPVEIQEEVYMARPANVVRLGGVTNDTSHHRLSVRFVVGFLNEKGAYQQPLLDDGIVFSGPTYEDHKFHDLRPSSVDEADLLTRIATFLKWDGQMRPYTE